MKISFIVLTILLNVCLISSTTMVHFKPYAPSDNECSGPISGFGFVLPIGICVGNSDLTDLPGSFYAEQWNSTAVMLNTYINIYFKTDCSGNPTSEYPYLLNECNYDSYEGNFDETDYRYVPVNVTSSDPLDDIPSGSVLYQVYDNKCENVQSSYYITGNTTIGPNTDIPMTYYCVDGKPMQTTCYKEKCSSYSLASQCGSYDNQITVSCTQ